MEHPDRMEHKEITLETTFIDISPVKVNCSKLHNELW